MIDIADNEAAWAALAKEVETFVLTRDPTSRSEESVKKQLIGADGVEWELVSRKILPKKVSMLLPPKVSRTIPPKKSEPVPVIVSAVARLRPEDRERYAEEWLADYLEITGRFRRWRWSVWLRWSAYRLSRRAAGKTRIANDI